MVTPASEYENHGVIAVVLDVDSEMDMVFSDLHGTGHLVGLDRAIQALREIRAGLAALSQGHDDPGRCLVTGGWGGCDDVHGHGGDHQFPTEADWRALHDHHLRAAAS